MSDHSDASPRAIHTPWPRDLPPPDERQARACLAAEGLAPYAWGNPPSDEYPTHEHAFHKTLICLSGSLTVGLPDRDTRIELSAGDRLELPARIRHNARAGPKGVVCLEAHRARQSAGSAPESV